MTDTNADPVRLFEDPSGSPLLRGDLSAAAEAKVTGLDLAAGLAGLGAVVAANAASAGAVSTTASAAPMAATGLSVLAKAAIVGGLVVVSVGAWVGLSRSVTGDSAPSTASEPVRPPRVREPSTVVPAPVPTPAPAAVVVPPEEDAVVEPAAEPERPKATSSKSKQTEARLSTEDAMAEAGLISRARKALALKPSEALLLTDQAKRGFPKGMLVEEREAIAILALAKLGKHDAAAVRGRRFLKRYRRGAHARAVREALEQSD